MDSKIGFEMSLIVVEAIRGRCASFMSLPATVSEIFGGQTTPSILVVQMSSKPIHLVCTMQKAATKLLWRALPCRWWRHCVQLCMTVCILHVN